MTQLHLSGWNGREGMEEGYNPHKLSSPMHYFWIMVVFLIIVGFVGAILFRQAHNAFLANPGLNGLILGVLLIGILLVFNHVLGLRPEVRWFNSFRAAGSADKVGRDAVKVESVSLADDGKTVRLRIRGLKPVHQMMIAFKGLKSANSSSADATIYSTINYIPD